MSGIRRIVFLLLAVLAATLFWLAPPSDKTSESTIRDGSLDSVPLSPQQEVSDPNPSVSRSSRSDWEAIDSIEVSSETASVIEEEIDCSATGYLPIGGNLPQIPDHLPPFNYHDGASDEELTERASLDDGYAQQVYANRLQNELLKQLAHIDLNKKDARKRWEEDFDAMEKMSIQAVQNRSSVSARMLGDTYLMSTPRRDPIKAVAWLLIARQMGNRYLDMVRDSGFLELSKEDLETSELLMASYIEQHALRFLDPAFELDFDEYVELFGRCSRY